MTDGLNGPLIYAITDGSATADDFDRATDRILTLVRAAIAEEIAFIQVREKHLSGKQLFILASRCAKLTRGTSTRLVINDRADIASAAGADGVHLTEISVPVEVIRREFGSDLIIGASVHTSESARSANTAGADFVVYGPVFNTPGKGEAVGLESLARTCSFVAPFPVIGVGGIDASNCRSVIRAGAAGVAGIRSFGDRTSLSSITIALDHE